MNKSKFIDLINSTGRAATKEINALEGMVKTYPYCQSLRSILAKNSHISEAEDAQKSLHTAAIYSSNRTQLKKFIEGKIAIPTHLDQKEPEKKMMDEHFQIVKQEKATEKITIKEEEPVETPKVDEAVLSSLKKDAKVIDFDARSPAKEEKVDDDEMMRTLEELKRRKKELALKEIKKAKAPVVAKKKVGRQKKKDPTEELIENIKEKDKKPLKKRTVRQQSEIINDYLKDEKAVERKRKAAAKQKNENPKDLSVKSTSVDGSINTETYAALLVKQGKHVEAIEILKNIVAENPEKSRKIAPKLKKLEEKIKKT